ncbi:hypothetical protein CU669_02105 [Paramagnetospirillum kuznetsovii]|uniref:Uncharacterized protein n=1 Tax=Paramagnetospirillum kuznetsovii TaxID=2053833 RepID=A0A364P3L9_9PROT|nr:hypothetical protein [Paramagnetospirillum kuznetsovii]RAU23891.1 hypothetical protein CU669_02105 [Paramagnetospirillum kuznetsovii]
MAFIRHAVTALLILLAAPALAEGFLSAYEDLPLAPGLAEAVGSGVAFDSPGGRIVETYARGSVKSADVLRFYAATLPQLGWTRESDTVYRREAEVLRLDPTTQGRVLTIRFAISPE